MSAIIITALIILVFMLVTLLLVAQQNVGEGLSMEDFNIVFDSIDDLGNSIEKTLYGNDKSK